jgi:hypothetical protein
VKVFASKFAWELVVTSVRICQAIPSASIKIFCQARCHDIYNSAVQKLLLIDFVVTDPQKFLFQAEKYADILILNKSCIETSLRSGGKKTYLGLTVTVFRSWNKCLPKLHCFSRVTFPFSAVTFTVETAENLAGQLYIVPLLSVFCWN